MKVLPVHQVLLPLRQLETLPRLLQLPVHHQRSKPTMMIFTIK